MGQTKLGKCVIKALMCDNFSAFHIITREQKKIVNRRGLHKFSFAFYLHNSNFITSGNYCYSQRTTKLTSSKNKLEPASQRASDSKEVTGWFYGLWKRLPFAIKYHPKRAKNVFGANYIGIYL